MRITLHARWQDWRLRRKHEKELAELQATYAPAIEKLRGSERQMEIAAYFSECQFPQAELDILDTKYLEAKARALGIEIPKDKEWWDDDDYHQSRFLTDTGKTRLTKLIRQEKWERRKRLMDIAAVLVPALTGLLGTLIGVLSFLQKK